MADGGDSQTLQTARSIAGIGREAWDACANPPNRPYDPFISYDFLSALEDSKSVGVEAGWEPLHLALEETGRIAGVAPLYLKAHSQGEYVFDHHWADAYQRAGGSYYPKLTAAAPFTPVPGRRLLAETPAQQAALAAGIRALAIQLRVSSAHVNFIAADEERALAQSEFLPRRGVQYHWFNRGYASFDDFLGALASRKRKAIRRERDAALESGVKISRLIGPDIKERHWAAFWAFYQDTGNRKWGRPYLTQEFFFLIGERMARNVLLVIAERGGVPIAGALNFIGGNAAFGRYWGCTEYHPFLHFELSYHQAIEFAIEHKLSRVEAGAQGEHKIARGYEPVETLSAHWIADANFRVAINRYLQDERAQNTAEMSAIATMTPFRKQGDAPESPDEAEGVR